MDEKISLNGFAGLRFWRSRRDGDHAGRLPDALNLLLLLAAWRVARISVSDMRDHSKTNPGYRSARPGLLAAPPNMPELGTTK